MGIVCSGPQKDFITPTIRSESSALKGSVAVLVSDDGFRPSNLVVEAGQSISFKWNAEESSPGFNVIQVSSSDLYAVPGGYNSGSLSTVGSYDISVGKTGCFTFISESLPLDKTLTVKVVEKPVTEIKINDRGFEPQWAEIQEGDTVRWHCSIEDTELTSSCYIQEMKYCFKHGGFIPRTDRVEVRLEYEKRFQDVGLYYFCLEETVLEKEKDWENTFFCAIRVVERSRDFTVQLSDEGLKPNFILANVKDRIWLDCSTTNKKLVGKIEDAVIYMTADGRASHPLVSAKLTDSLGGSRVSGLVSYHFLEPGVYQYIYKMADLTRLRGCVVVQPKMQEHVIEINEGDFEPTLCTVYRGERVWWSAVQEEHCWNSSLYLKEVESCVSPKPLLTGRHQKPGCLCKTIPHLLKFANSLGLATNKFESTGVFTYQLQDSNMASLPSSLCSILVQRGAEHYTVRVHDQGFTPKILNVHPGDCVWWRWDNTERHHNIRQVTHQRTLMRDGFDSGEKPVRSPSAFRHVFSELGVFYFASNGLPEVFGAVVVTPDSQVHQLQVSDRGIDADPLVISSNHCVCWVWCSGESYSVQEISQLVEISTAAKQQPNPFKRCYTQLFRKPGIYHFLCTAHHFESENQSSDSFVNTVLVDPVSYSYMVGLSSEGFKPSVLTIAKSQSVLWTWNDQRSEEHNIVHVRPPQPGQNLVRVRGLSAFDSGPVSSGSTFFHTFDIPGSYFITSEGTNQRLCVIDVLENAVHVSPPEIRDTERNGGNVECGYRVFLTCETDQAAIFYTVDGSFPVECNPKLVPYEYRTGIGLSWPGLVVIRAIAKKEGLVTSDVFTSKRFWVLEYDETLQNEPWNELEPILESESEEVNFREEILRWHWLSCKPYITVGLVCDNTFHVDITFSNAADQSWIRGFQVFLNGSAYGGWFRPQCRNLVISGLIGRKVYHVALVVFSTQESHGPQLSNEVVISCPAVSSSGGPLVSLEASNSPQSLAIVWPSCCDVSLNEVSYSVFINGRPFGDQIVPDPQSDYCRVLFESSARNELYSLCVACHVPGCEQPLYSNEIEFSLPVPEEILRALDKANLDNVSRDVSIASNGIHNQTVSRELLLVVERTDPDQSGAGKPRIEKLSLKTAVNKLETIPEGERLDLIIDPVEDFDANAVFQDGSVEPDLKNVDSESAVLDLFQFAAVDEGYSQVVEEEMFAACQEDVLGSELNDVTPKNGRETPADMNTEIKLPPEEGVEFWDQGDMIDEDGASSGPSVAGEGKHGTETPQSVSQNQASSLTSAHSESEKKGNDRGEQEGNSNIAPVQDGVDTILNNDGQAGGDVIDEGGVGTESTADGSAEDNQTACDEKSKEGEWKGRDECLDTADGSSIHLVGKGGDKEIPCTEIHPGDPNTPSSSVLTQVVERNGFVINPGDESGNENLLNPQASSQEVPHTEECVEHIENESITNNNCEDKKENEDLVEQLAFSQVLPRSEGFEHFDNEQVMSDCTRNEKFDDKDEEQSHEPPCTAIGNVGSNKEETSVSLEIEASEDVTANGQSKTQRTSQMLEELRLSKEDELLGDSTTGEVVERTVETDLGNEIPAENLVERQLEINERTAFLGDGKSKYTDLADETIWPAAMEDNRDTDDERPEDNRDTDDECPEDNRDTDDRCPDDAWSATSSHGSNVDNKESDSMDGAQTSGRVGLTELYGNLLASLKKTTGDPVSATGPAQLSAERNERDVTKTSGNDRDGPNGNSVDPSLDQEEHLLPKPLVVIKGTTPMAVTLEWEWQLLPEEIAGADIVFSLLILGSKFNTNINSDFCYNFEDSPAKTMWPEKRASLKQHAWRTTNSVIEITGLKQRCSYRLGVLGHLMPYARESLSHVMTFTMPGPPKPPVIHVTALKDREVTLSWKAVLGFGEATVIGYRVLVNSQVYGEDLGHHIFGTTIEELETGRDHTLRVIALTGHSVGDSKPSKAITIHCPTPPLPPQIYQKETAALGSICVAWQRYDPANAQEAQAQYSFAVFVDGRLHGECPVDNVADIFLEEHVYTIMNCERNKKYEVYVKSYSSPQVMDSEQGGKSFVCGCYGDSSNLLELSCAGPPSPPLPRVSRIDSTGVTVCWERSQEFGGVSLSGYLLYVNGKWSGELLSPSCQETTLLGLKPGDVVRIQLAAATLDLAGPIPGVNNQTVDNSRYFRPCYDPTDSGVESSTSFLSRGSVEDRQYTCVTGPSLVIKYSYFVKKVKSIQVSEVGCRSALIAWAFDEIADRSVEPERVCALCWKTNEKNDTAVRYVLTGKPYVLRGLDPGVEYSLSLECTAPHPNDTPQNSPINISQSSIVTFKTGSPPDPPKNVHLVSSTEHSVKLAWDSPVERGAVVEMLLLNVRRVSLNFGDYGMNFQLSCDTRAFTVDFLAARTEYVFTLQALTKDDLLESNSAESCSSASVSAWTNGVDPATRLTVHARRPTSLVITWQPSVPYGLSYIKHYQVHYIENRQLHKRSRGKTMPAKEAGKKIFVESDCCEVEMTELEPGTVYRIVVETVAGVTDYSYEDDFENEDNETTSTVGSELSLKPRGVQVLCLSEPLLVCTAAPPEPPVLLVSGFTTTQIHLFWSKPLLLRSVVESRGSSNMDQARGRVRSLRGYRLEVNGRVHAKVAASKTSFVVKKCKSGMKYSCVLVVLTGPEKIDDFHKKHDSAVGVTPSDTDTDEENNCSLSGCLEEAASQPVEVTLPRQDWGVSLGASYCANKPTGSLRDSPCSESGEEEAGVVIQWNMSGLTGDVIGYRVVWYYNDGNERNEVFLPPDAKCYEIWSVLPSTLYTGFLELVDDKEKAVAVYGPVHCQTPGPPFSPWIWCRSLSPYQFTVEWNEPVTYGDVTIRAYQVLLNNRRLNKMVERRQRHATIHCQSSSVYHVSVVALSSDPLLGDSSPSNVLRLYTPVAVNSTMGRTPSGGVSRASFGITVHVVSTSNDSISFKWSHSPGEVETADHYLIKWSSVLQPQIREIALPLHQSCHVIEDCLPGTSHFIVVAAVNAGGGLVSRSEQHTIQTSAPVEKPRISLISCLQSGITVEWRKPTCFGDATIDCFVLVVNDDVEKEMNTDCLSYTFLACVPCLQYIFKLKAISVKPECDSDWSEPLIVTCPGAERPLITRIPSKMLNCIRVGWEKPNLKGGAMVDSYKVYYLKDSGRQLTSDDIVSDPDCIVHGPLPRYTEQDKLLNVPPDPYYWVVLQMELSPVDCLPVCSLPIRTRPAVSPDPAVISLEVEGLEQRAWLEERICELTNRKDRIHRVIHLLENSVVVKGSKMKDLQVATSTDAMLEVDSELADALEAVKDSTGSVSAIVRWSRPRDDGDAVVSGYQVFVDGDCYGNPLSNTTLKALVQLPVTFKRHVITVQTLTRHPVGPSPLSNPVELAGEEFLPFVMFCYFDVHKRGESWPARGCCSWQGSHSYELNQRGKPSPRVFIPKGILTRRIPCSVCSVMEVFSALWKPVSTVGVANMTALLFWSKWCLSSQKVMSSFMKFAEEFKEQFSFVTCCVRSEEPIMTHRQSLVDTITERGWSRNAQNVTHLCGCYSRQGQRARSARREIPADPDVCQLFGLVGVPTLILLDSSGYISWHGRVCCRDDSSFRNFMLHSFSLVNQTQCPVLACEHCELETEGGQQKPPETHDQSSLHRSKEFRHSSADLSTLYLRLHGSRPSEGNVTSPYTVTPQKQKRDVRPKTTSATGRTAAGIKASNRFKQPLRSHSQSFSSHGRTVPKITAITRPGTVGGLSPSSAQSPLAESFLPVVTRRGKRTHPQERGSASRVKTKISVDDFTLK